MDNEVEPGRGQRMPVVPLWITRATGFDDRGFLIRFGPRLRQACYVYETPPAADFAADRRSLVAMWRRAAEAG